MKEEKQVSKPKSNKGLKIISLLLIVISISLIAGGVYFLLKPTTVLKQSYQYLAKAFQMGNNKNTELINKDKVKYEGNFHISLGESLNLGINSLDLKLTAEEDKTAKISQYKIETKMNDMSLVNASAILKDNRIYAKLQNIMDKYYYMEQEYVSLMENNQADIQILIDKLSDSIQRKVTEDKLSQTEETKKIEGTEEKVKKVSLDVTNKLVADILKDTLSNIEKDTKAKEAWESLVTEEKSREEFLKMLNDVQNEKEEVLFTYNIYYKGLNQIQMIEFAKDDEKIMYTNKDKAHFIYTSKEQQIVDMTVENGETQKFTILAEDLKISGEYTAEKLEFAIESDNKNIATISIQNKWEELGEMKLEDTKDAKNIEQITEVEINEILTNLQNHPIIGPYLALLNPPVEAEGGMLGGNNDNMIFGESNSNIDFEDDEDSNIDYSEYTYEPEL